MTDKEEYYEESLRLHARHKGKLEITGKVRVRTEEEMKVAYLPGAIEPCLLIERAGEDARKYSIKANTIAVVSDGSAVPGLGNIGGPAALPMIEGKALLFKEFGEVDAFPLCLSTQDPDEIVLTVKSISPAFGGICLDGISAPGCFEIKRRLREELDIPVWLDSGDGIAAVVNAALINACRLTGRPLSELKAVVFGAGAAGSAIAKMLVRENVQDIVVCDSKGIISASRISEFEEDKLELLELTNKNGLSGNLMDAIAGRDLFIGVSKPDILTEVMVRSMAKEPWIFALADPDPEILPEKAKAAGAYITCTGSQDYANYITNTLLTPGLFRGLLDAEADGINDEIVSAAIRELAGLVPGDELSEDCLLPFIFDEDVAARIAEAVAKVVAEKTI